MNELWQHGYHHSPWPASFLLETDAKLLLYGVDIGRFRNAVEIAEALETLVSDWNPHGICISWHNWWDSHVHGPGLITNREFEALLGAFPIWLNATFYRDEWLSTVASKARGLAVFLQEYGAGAEVRGLEHWEREFWEAAYGPITPAFTDPGSAFDIVSHPEFRAASRNAGVEPPPED